MTTKTKIFNLNYELLFLKGTNKNEEKIIAKELLYFLDNYKLNENVLLNQIEKEDWYKLKFNKNIEELNKNEKEDLIDTHIDFIANSCVELLN